MSTVEITAGTVEPLEAYARAAAGGALTGSANLRVQIRRLSDGYFLDFNDSTFKNAGWTTRQATISEISSTNAPGEYRLTSGVDTTGWSAGSYAVTFLEVSTSLVANGPQFATGEIRIVTATPSALSARIPAALVSGRMDASVGAIADGTITAAAIADGAIDAGAIADNAITSAKIAADAIGASQIAADAIGASELAAGAANEIADALLDRALSGHTSSGTAGEALSRMDAAVTSRLASANYTAPPSAGDNASAVWGAGTRTLSGIGSSGIASQASVDAIGGFASAASIADAVCDELLSGHTTAGSVGEALGRLDTTVSSRAAPGAAMDLVDNAVDAGAVAASAVTELQTGLATSTEVTAVGTAVADVQTRLPAALVSGRMDASVGAMQADTITSAAVAASAVTEIQSGLATATNVSAVGTVVAAVGVAVDAVAVDVDDLQTRVPAALVLGRMDSHVGAMATDTITSGALAASAVTEVQNNLATAAAVAGVDTKVADVQGRIPAALVGGRIDASVGAMEANTLTASALAADAVAEITSGVGAAVWATAVSAPASGTYGRYVQRIFQLGFNRLELASTGGGQNVLYADDASTPMVTFALRDVAGSALVLTGGSPARRGAGVES